MHAIQRDRFPAVTSDKVRLLVLGTKDGQTPSVFDFGVYEAPSP